MTNTLNPITPGQILLHHFLEPMGISQNRLAGDIDVPVTRINGVVNGKRSITVDTALRLGTYFNVDPRWWLNMQMQHDLECAEDGGWPEAKARIRTIPSVPSVPSVLPATTEHRPSA